ncbi:MAG: GtrA family protein [Clostridia bacterium]|nr:GtrA family protein [Clostridia bacterium]
MIAIRELFLKLKRTFISKKFIEFCLLGVFNTLNHAFLTMFLSKVMQENVAYAIGYFISLTVAFILCSYIIFKKPVSFQGYLKFYVSYIPSFIISFLVSFITIQIMQLPPFWATIVAAAIGAPVTFVIMKIFTFRNR